MNADVAPSALSSLSRTPQKFVHLSLGSDPLRGRDMTRSEFTEEQIIAILREQGEA